MQQKHQQQSSLRHERLPTEIWARVLRNYVGSRTDISESQLTIQNLTLASRRFQYLAQPLLFSTFKLTVLLQSDDHHFVTGYKQTAQYYARFLERLSFARSDHISPSIRRLDICRDTLPTDTRMNIDDDDDDDEGEQEPEDGARDMSDSEEFVEMDVLLDILFEAMPSFPGLTHARFVHCRLSPCHLQQLSSASQLASLTLVHCPFGMPDELLEGFKLKRFKFRSQGDCPFVHRHPSNPTSTLRWLPFLSSSTESLRFPEPEDTEELVAFVSSHTFGPLILTNVRHLRLCYRAPALPGFRGAMDNLPSLNSLFFDNDYSGDSTASDLMFDDPYLRLPPSVHTIGGDWIHLRALLTRESIRHAHLLSNNTGKPPSECLMEMARLCPGLRTIISPAPVDVESVETALTQFPALEGFHAVVRNCQANSCSAGVAFDKARRRLFCGVVLSLSLSFVEPAMGKQTIEILRTANLTPSLRVVRLVLRPPASSVGATEPVNDSIGDLHPPLQSRCPVLVEMYVDYGAGFVFDYSPRW